MFITIATGGKVAEKYVAITVMVLSYPEIDPAE
jgi:hypothetical protein